MQDERPQKLALAYQPVGKRNKGHPKKRWEDRFLEESSRMQAQQAYFLTVQEEEEEDYYSIINSRMPSIKIAVDDFGFIS
jgi:hypothetical protein